VAATVEYYEQVFKAFGYADESTILIGAGATRESVAAALDIDLSAAVEHPWEDEDPDSSAWALVEIPGGVLGVEQTGYGDPSLTALRELTRGGGAAAVVRNNIQAHTRFGCARDGEILFDEDEYIYDADPEEVPTELRPLFDLVYDDLENEDDEDEDGPDPMVVGLAMAEVITGIELLPEHAAAMASAGWHKGPSLTYASDHG
jgi:hypothetical protein